MIRQATETPRWTPEAAETEVAQHRLASPAPPPARIEHNVGLGERLASGALAGALASGAVNLVARRGGVLGVLGALAAGGLAVELVRRAVTGHSRFYQAVGVRADDAGVRSHPLKRWVHVEHRVTVARSPRELYERWRDLASLPRFMRDIERVEPMDESRSHWVARGPRGRRFAWDAVLTEDVPAERIAWRSLPGGDIQTEGSVQFDEAPSDRGTTVTVYLRHRFPGGAFAAVTAQLFGQAPAQQLRASLRRFKSLAEAGEIPTIEGQPRGRCG
ncbi:MAG: SRPBCC family protein [Phycisphaeraceae bacterium]